MYVVARDVNYNLLQYGPIPEIKEVSKVTISNCKNIPKWLIYEFFVNIVFYEILMLFGVL